ncbi:hypothetical protein F5146DRAFT_882885, partial [Armillaria mellea]
VTGSTIMTSKGASDGRPAEAERKPRYQYSNKKHCCIIYKDIGKLGAILFLLTLDVIFILGTLLGLMWIYKSGYVHWDLSGGNLIWIEDMNITKITDIEYGKK